jgi:hypothetical protein
MFVLRVLKNAYELFDATDVVRLAKSSVRNMAALGLATRMIDGDGDRISDAPVFVGSAFSPSATGSDALVSLKPGMAFYYDTSEGDTWLGEVKLAFADDVQTIALPVNNDASGDDRIDVISLKTIEVEEDDQLRWFKDPITLLTSQKESPQRVRLDFELVVTTGTAAPSPVAPSTPAGNYKVSEVTRVNGQANVNPSDVADSRAPDRIRASWTEGLLGLVARAGATYFGDPDGDHYRLERDSDTAPTHLRIRNQLGAPTDLEVGELWATRYVQTDNFRARNNSGDLGVGVVEFYDDDASETAVILSSNTPIAWGSFVLTGSILVAQEHSLFGGVSTKVATGRYKIEFQAVVGVSGVVTNAGAVLATSNATNGAGTPLIVLASLSTDGAAYGGSGGTVCNVDFYDFAGALADPGASEEVSLLVFSTLVV